MLQMVTEIWYIDCNAELFPYEKGNVKLDEPFKRERTVLPQAFQFI